MTNPLKSEKAQAHIISGYRAGEYAMLARAKGHKDEAKAWEQADCEGWDGRHFSQARRDELERKFGKPTGYRGDI